MNVYMAQRYYGSYESTLLIGIFITQELARQECVKSLETTEFEYSYDYDSHFVKDCHIYEFDAAEFHAYTIEVDNAAPIVRINP